jgi:hypothetical protein
MVGKKVFALISTSYHGNPPQVSVYATEQGAIDALNNEIGHAQSLGLHVEEYHEKDKAVFNSEGDEILIDYRIDELTVRE